MSELRVQTLCVPDCVAAIERGYYGWGQGRPADSPEPSWEDATPKQRHDIALRGYSLYDGYPAQRGNEISAAEICTSVGINSRVVLNDVVRFLVRADEARPLLARIPDDARLEQGTDDQIAAAGDLIDLFASAFEICRGKATKVLYKKRPAFMPILDSVVADFLWKNFPHDLRGNSPVDHVLRLYQQLLRERAPVLERTQTRLAGKGFRLSTSRVLNYLIWLGWRRNVGRAGFGAPITKVWATKQSGRGQSQSPPVVGSPEAG